LHLLDPGLLFEIYDLEWPQRRSTLSVLKIGGRALPISGRLTLESCFAWSPQLGPEAQGPVERHPSGPSELLGHRSGNPLPELL